MTLQLVPASTSNQSATARDWQDRRGVVVVLIGTAELVGPALEQPPIQGRVVVFKRWADAWSDEADDFIGDVVEHAPGGAWLLLVGSRRDVLRARWAALGSGFAPGDIKQQLVA